MEPTFTEWAAAPDSSAIGCNGDGKGDEKKKKYYNINDL